MSLNHTLFSDRAGCFSVNERALYGNFITNIPRSIYQYSNMHLAPRRSRQISIFSDVFFVSKSLWGIEKQKKL